MFKVISLLRDMWQLRAENSALKSRLERMERQEDRPAPSSPAGGERDSRELAQELARLRGELDKARARLARVREVVFRVRPVQRGVTHA